MKTTTLIRLFMNENGTTEDIEMAKIEDQLDKKGITGQKRQDMLDFFRGPVMECEKREET